MNKLALFFPNTHLQLTLAMFLIHYDFTPRASQIDFCQQIGF